MYRSARAIAMTGDPKHLMSHVVVSLRAKVYTDSTGAFAELPALLTEGGVALAFARLLRCETA